VGERGKAQHNKCKQKKEMQNDQQQNLSRRSMIGLVLRNRRREGRKMIAAAGKNCKPQQRAL